MWLRAFTYQIMYQVTYVIAHTRIHYYYYYYRASARLAYASTGEKYSHRYQVLPG